VRAANRNGCGGRRSERLKARHDELAGQIALVKKGDMSRAEGMLVAQAHTRGRKALRELARALRDQSEFTVRLN